MNERRIWFILAFFGEGRRAFIYILVSAFARIWIRCGPNGPGRGPVKKDFSSESEKYVYFRDKFCTGPLQPNPEAGCLRLSDLFCVLGVLFLMCSGVFCSKHW